MPDIKRNLFENDGVKPCNSKWDAAVKRERSIYRRENEMRSEFARDYTRILHSGAYRRLKHKTQVFCATNNDHVCTRIEHVTHVASVSNTIADVLGLNTELTNAIAIGHDLGHAPFGHTGEIFIREITKKELGETFWHEKNGLRFVDKCETLEDDRGIERNLNLTYAVRDGIISHCGEVNENAIFPRNEAIALETIERPSQYQPFTWEGCIVKISDKISYLGRDIEDALRLNILTDSQLKELRQILKKTVDVEIGGLNNTVLMHDFIKDLCISSNPREGIKFSNKYLELINMIKEFNYKNIYFHKRLGNYIKYAELIINSIFNGIKEFYAGGDTLNEIKKYQKFYPVLTKNFSEWLMKYSDLNDRKSPDNRFENEILYRIENRKDFLVAIIDFISGMTDHFAISVFGEMTNF
ncbi:MAG: HD domain-containing protein [Candidatus Wallbacteria bacterium]